MLDFARNRAVAATVAAGALLAWTGVAQAAPESFAPVIKKVSPAVVNISTTREVAGVDFRQRNPQFTIPRGAPFERFFRDDERGENPFPFEEEHPELMQGQGSGFIIDQDGYVVTNNHVIDGADVVTVTLTDGRQFAADVVGVDSYTDLALLKFETEAPVPMVSFGDSDVVEVGDWVVAVGNPFGLGGSVSAGIVSARGRNINAGPYDDFLQVDAPINRGNSGGPLFNGDGEVIGVNTAIFSPSGGNVGIGFAIPANMARDVIDQLRGDGSVERGWLGVQIQPVTADIATALGLEGTHGAMVARVMPDTPAAAAEFHQGDVILSFNGQEILTARDLTRIVAGTQPGKAVDATVWRDGARHDLSVTVAQRTEEQRAALEPNDADADQGTALTELGARLAPLNDEARERFGVETDVEGVVVTDIDSSGAAYQRGLRAGDIIVEVGGNKVTTPQEVGERLSAMKDEKAAAALLLVERRGEPLFVGIPIA